MAGAIDALRAFVDTRGHPWWMSAGHEPTIEEAKARLEHLKRHGLTPYAFTFGAGFPAPDASRNAARIDDEIGCPA